MKIKHFIFIFACFFLFIFFIPKTSFSQPDEQLNVVEKSLFATWYDGGEMLHITIDTDFKRLLRQKMKEEYQKATLTYHEGDSLLVSWDLKIRTRGNMRKQVCFYPPLKMKFPKSDLKDEGFLTEFNKIKLAIQCKSSTACEQYIFKEYLIYKLYNILSPYSYNVKLGSVKFIDSGNTKSKPHEQYTIILENDDEMASRLQGNSVKVSKGNWSMINEDQSALMTMFQYMVGNTDWAVPNMHNLRCFKFPEENKYFFIPYDFDYAGLVSTYYAIPHPSLGLKDVKIRYYKGRKYSQEVLDETIEIFKSKKTEILDYCGQFTYLDKRNKKEVIDYLEQFFNLIEKPKFVKREFPVKKEEGK